jgi:hypothetical protein
MGVIIPHRGFCDRIFETEEIASRVEINEVEGSLTIDPVTEWDTEVFTCWVGNAERAAFTLG